jgi:hypothetical protein
VVNSNYFFAFSFALMQKNSRRIGMFQKNQGQPAYRTGRPDRSARLSGQRHRTCLLNCKIFILSIKDNQRFWSATCLKVVHVACFKHD